jgi:peptidoglycan/LPS O-acetylase OafA/YrhL
MFHTSIDILMMGCVAAFLLDSPVWLERIRKVPTNAVLVVSAVFLFGIEPYVLDHFAAHTLAHSVVDATMPTFEGGMIAASILVLVAGQGGFARNVLNRRPVMHVGKLSYSIYLWQQFFFASGSASNLLAVLWRIPVIYVIGLCSFNLVEKPFLKLRKRFRRVATD